MISENIAEPATPETVEGWENGIVYGLQPSEISHFAIGNTLLPRTMIESITIGKTTL